MSGEGRGWGFAAPALIWTGAFFLVPFLVMGAMSLATLEGREVVWGISGENYADLMSRAYLRRAVIVSLEITLTVTAVSVCLAYPLAWIIAHRVPERWQRLVLMLATCPSGPPMWCAPMRGCWCWRGRAG